MKLFEPFQSVTNGCIAFYGNGTPFIDDTRSYTASPSFWKGKIGVYYDYEYVSSIKNEFDWKKDNPALIPSIGDRIYVSKNSKVSRDVLRNSGYTITLSPEKASYVLMPHFEEGALLEGDIFVNIKSENKLVIFYIEYRSRSVYFQGLDKLIKSAIESKYGVDNVEIMYKANNDGFNRRSIWFLPNCEEYKAVISDNKVKGPYYIWDIDIPMAGSVTINPETLIVWGNMDDNKILEKQLINSNWQEYPVTVLAALETSDKYIYSEFGPQGQTILNALRFRDSDYMKDRVTITPKDYEMFQAWAFAYLGISEKGGYADYRKFNKLPSRYRDMLKFRTALIPDKIDVSTTVLNVRQKQK